MADIYTGKLDPTKDLEKIDRLVVELETMADGKTILKGNIENCGCTQYTHGLF